MTRARDLMANADRQLADRSYDAAIDTYRTALAELSVDDSADDRAELEARLATAMRKRDESRGTEPLLREARAHAEAGRDAEAAELARRVLAFDPANAEAAKLSGPSQPVAAPVVVEPAPVAPPPPEPVPPSAPIDAPSFNLIEDDPSMLERPRRYHEYGQDPEPPISILDPKPLPDPPDRTTGLLIACILIVVFFVAIFATANSRHAARSRPTPSRMAVPTDPLVVSKVQPVYPDDARAAGIEGTVDLLVEVRPDGSAEPRSIIQGMSQELNAAAVAAVRQWRFQPSLLNDAPVVSMTRVTVKFPPE